MNTDLSSDVRQARDNRKAYEAKFKDQLEPDSVGSFALMNNGNVVGVYDDLAEGYRAGCDKFGEREFSLIKIGEQIMDLGALNHLLVA